MELMVDLDGHALAYREAFRVVKPGGRFYQWHLGQQSISFTDSGGNFVDACTVDNIANPNVPLNNNGLTCFLTPALMRALLSDAGFVDVAIETVMRTYNECTLHIEYLSVEARRP